VVRVVVCNPNSFRIHFLHLCILFCFEGLPLDLEARNWALVEALTFESVPVCRMALIPTWLQLDIGIRSRG